MWRSYFPAARIFGVDISDFSSFNSNWFRFYQADCGDARQLDQVVTELRGSGVIFDIILDDASHASFHQQLAMLKFFPRLNPGRLYIIEDLNWQPRSYETRLPKVPKTSKLLADKLETGKFKNTVKS
jgi:hypothetical protein